MNRIKTFFVQWFAQRQEDILGTERGERNFKPLYEHHHGRMILHINHNGIQEAERNEDTDANLEENQFDIRYELKATSLAVSALKAIDCGMHAMTITSLAVASISIAAMGVWIPLATTALLTPVTQLLPVKIRESIRQAQEVAIRTIVTTSLQIIRDRVERPLRDAQYQQRSLTHSLAMQLIRRRVVPTPRWHLNFDCTLRQNATPDERVAFECVTNSLQSLQLLPKNA